VIALARTGDPEDVDNRGRGGGQGVCHALVLGSRKARQDAVGLEVAARQRQREIRRPRVREEHVSGDIHRLTRYIVVCPGSATGGTGIGPHVSFSGISDSGAFIASSQVVVLPE
jgi:hypothetical protein